MLSSFVIPFITIGLAELGDKTQLALILLSSKTRKKTSLIIGAVMGFLLIDGLSVILGAQIAEIVPETTLKIISSALFILFGILMLKGLKDDDDTKKTFSKNPLLNSFLLISVTEFGDKTQLATAVFATRYEPLLVLAGAMASLTILSMTAVYLGSIISKRIPADTTTKIAGALFILMGVGIHII
ncbi:TMEM165/GDT1 family protein [Candidatus Altiarchaeota archaeon]